MHHLSAFAVSTLFLMLLRFSLLETRWPWTIKLKFDLLTKVHRNRNVHSDCNFKAISWIKRWLSTSKRCLYPSFFVCSFFFSERRNQYIFIDNKIFPWLSRFFFFQSRVHSPWLFCDHINKASQDSKIGKLMRINQVLLNKLMMSNARKQTRLLTINDPWVYKTDYQLYITLPNSSLFSILEAFLLISFNLFTTRPWRR